MIIYGGKAWLPGGLPERPWEKKLGIADKHAHFWGRLKPGEQSHSALLFMHYETAARLNRLRKPLRVNVLVTPTDYRPPPTMTEASKWACPECKRLEERNAELKEVIEELREELNLLRVASSAPRCVLLRRAREAAGISQAEMAEKAHVTRSSYSKWERGEDPIPNSRHAKFVEILGPYHEQEGL